MAAAPLPSVRRRPVMIAAALWMALGIQLNCARARTGVAATPAADSVAADSLAADSATTPSQSKVAIVVSNHHWLDVRIYMVRGGVTRRLGTAGSQSTTTFTVPVHRLDANGEIRLRAETIGGNDAVETDRLMLRGGEEVVWTIESQMALSSVLVY
jgi:hypothetical protein